MRHGSLFSGIGGFDLAAEWMGWENVFHCEWNPFGQKVLKHYWPDAISYTDITKTDFSIHRGEIDILTGGFPCQPFSGAGKKKGVEDNRYLWPEMLRAIREIQPSWILPENVYGIINQGRGLVFEQVQAEMENEGYEVQSYLLPACAVNAPHRRDRFWFVAYSSSNERYGQREERQQRRERWEPCSVINGNVEQGIASYTGNKGLQRGTLTGVQKNREWERGTEKQFGRCNEQRFRNAWEIWPTQSPLCRADDGIPDRMDRIKALGNAIVPQVAYEIFKAIELFEKENQ